MFWFCTDVPIEGIAFHEETYAAPLCPCRRFSNNKKGF